MGWIRTSVVQDYVPGTFLLPQWWTRLAIIKYVTKFAEAAAALLTRLVKMPTALA
jgi:hypothetical protein